MEFVGHSPPSRNPDAVSCSSQQLKRCGQNTTCPSTSRPSEESQDECAFGKILKFYIELDCSCHEHIASGVKPAPIRIGSGAPKILFCLFEQMVRSRFVWDEYHELMPEFLSVLR